MVDTESNENLPKKKIVTAANWALKYFRDRFLAVDINVETSRTAYVELRIEASETFNIPPVYHQFKEFKCYSGVYDFDDTSPDRPIGVA